MLRDWQGSHPASTFHGRPQPLRQLPHPLLGQCQCQVPLRLSPVTFPSWEVVTET
jgi:hypothetical protein